MFNPAKASENIKGEFIDYISTTHSFADKSLQKQFVEELKKTISRGPFLEVKDVFTTGKTIQALIDEGILSPLFSDLEAGKPNKKIYKRRLPIDRPLYAHQERAIRSIVAGNNAVISTGTGSGKTNCFLIPVINELLREQEAGTLGPGVRALFIYPMNALANDQMKNIRNILMYYPQITFGVYNGGTESDEEDAVALYEAMFSNENVKELRHRLDNEILSRDEMKKTPPNILFTNYAMLEHLLLRPKDDVLFSNADFKFVVLDEAHVYSGATGIETALLLRRLKARIAATRQTQFILTSATLGSDESSDEDIVTFAGNLCGVEFTKNNIIRAERKKYNPVYSYNSYPEALYNELADEKNYVREILKKHSIPFEEHDNEDALLYDFLIQCDLYHRMRMNGASIYELSELARILNVDIHTTISFVSLCTRAQKNGKSLIDARYHYFIKSLEGCYLSCGKEYKLFLTRQQKYFTNSEKTAVFEIAVCDDCGRFAFVGKLEDRKLKQTSKMEEQFEYFYPAHDDNTEIEDDDQDDENATKCIYYLCPSCGAIVAENELNNLPCDCGKEQYIKVIQARHLKTGARCGNCHVGTYKRMYLGNDAATAVLATSLYEELPETKYVDEETESSTAVNMFSRAAAKARKQERKAGRQFLVFSDSRQEAAKFACYLGKSYNEFLRRRGICHIIQEKKSEILQQTYTISDFVALLTNYFSSNRCFASSNADDSNQIINSRKNAWVAMLNELSRFSAPTSLTSLGQLQFEYLGNTDVIVHSIAEIYGKSVSDVKNLLDMLAFEIVKAGAIYPDTSSDIDDADREYIFYSPSQRFITYIQSPDRKKATVTNWAPRNKKGKQNEFYQTSKMHYVCNTLGITPSQAADFLKEYFDYLIDPENNAHCLIDLNKDRTFVMPAKNFRVNITGNNRAHWYVCQKCGKVTQFNISNRCPSIRCEGTIKEINPEELTENNHFANLYLSERMSPLFIKEHTAQLSKKESAEYQEQFIKKEINALSCSTTFEMGVDVGDLETVFLRDVPPLPSNYAQRAGRAGRSINAAAYALTFAKLSSHDLSFFKEPERMINGVILPPLFKIDNEKIVRRHIYAVALSMFFAENEYMYNHNDAKIFINEKGYQKFISWINTKPERLRTLLQKSIPDIDQLHKRIGIIDFSWIDAFSGEDGSFTQLITEYESNVENFKKIIAKLKKDNKLEEAVYCERKLQIYETNKLIDFLARGNILPRYGFPVDTVELYQNSTATNISRLRLSRDLQIAIAEYAPSSEIVADGRLYTSRYIRKSAIGTNKQDWYIGYIGKCENPSCDTINYSVVPISREGIACSSCGRKLQSMNFSASIEPRSGFVTERQDKEVPLTRQEKNYRTEDIYIGDTNAKIINKYNYKFNGITVQVESTTNDSLMVKSTNTFYVCNQCGYAIAEDESTGDRNADRDIKKGALRISTTKAHESLFGKYDCRCHDLDRRSLHHVFKTDVAKLSFDCDTSDKQTMVSTMYALLNAISQELNIERRDIRACLSQKIIFDHLHYSIIIYDSVPGGAGHSRRLVTQDGHLLYRIFKAAKNNMEKCNCDPSCYSCLRSYENQRIHDILSRKKAGEFLKGFIGPIEAVYESNIEMED